MKLVSLLPLNLREAEKEAKDEKPADDAEGGDENPFAAADDSNKDAGEESEKDAAADTGEEAEEGGDAKSSEEAKPLDIVFNPTRVRKYNDVKFKDNKGSVVSISRFGLTVKLPDETTVFVNFEDIL